VILHTFCLGVWPHSVTSGGLFFRSGFIPSSEQGRGVTGLSRGVHLYFFFVFWHFSEVLWALFVFVFFALRPYSNPDFTSGYGGIVSRPVTKPTLTCLWLKRKPPFSNIDFFYLPGTLTMLASTASLSKSSRPFSRGGFILIAVCLM
jgi:hypothetical protein